MLKPIVLIGRIPNHAAFSDTTHQFTHIVMVNLFIKDMTAAIINKPVKQLIVLWTVNTVNG